MIDFKTTHRPHQTALLILGLLIVATASAQAAPIQFSITDLGNVSGRGLDNGGNVIAEPIRNIVGTFDPASPYFVASDSLRIVDGTADGRLLIEGDGAFNSPYRHTIQTYVYYPATGAVIPNYAVQVGYGVKDSMGTGGVDMNERGDVVGVIVPPYGQNDGAPLRPFYYDSTSRTMQELNAMIPADSGWKLTDVYSINDLGQILGQGRNPEGQLTDFLLTPEGVPVPEPAAWAVFGLAAAFAWRKRRAG